MFFFCSTCPQPRVNLPDDWNENPNHPDNWKYTRGFVADGNFTAAHQKQARPEDDVWLKDGDSFMTRRGPYLSHLRDAIEDNDVSLFINRELTRGMTDFSQKLVMSTMLSTTKMYSIEVLMLQVLGPLLAFDMATFVRVRLWIFKRGKGVGIVFLLIWLIYKRIGK